MKRRIQLSLFRQVRSRRSWPGIWWERLRDCDRSGEAAAAASAASAAKTRDQDQDQERQIEPLDPELQVSDCYCGTLCQDRLES